MRVIEHKTIEAVRAALRGVTFRQPGGNTTVVVAHNGEDRYGLVVEVRLHGNLIAHFEARGGTLQAARVTLAGYNTPTTRSRVNALCNAFANGVRCGYFQRKYEAYWHPVDGSPARCVSASDWQSILYGVE